MQTRFKKFSGSDLGTINIMNHELFKADNASFVVAEMTASEAFGK